MEQNSKNKYLKILIPVIGGIAGGIIIGSLFIPKAVYKNTWYPHTRINGLDVAGRTLSDSKTAVLKDAESYGLTVTTKDAVFTIDGDAIAYKITNNSDIDRLYNKQHQSYAVFKEYNYRPALDNSFNKKKLKRLIHNSPFVQGTDTVKISKPKDAYVKYDKKQGKYVIVPEKEGNQIDEKKFYKYVVQAIRQNKRKLDLTRKDIYKKPSVTADSKSLKKELQAYQNYADKYIVWKIHDNKEEILTPAKLSKWVSYKNKKIKWNKEKVSSWVEQKCLKYKTLGQARKIKSHTGKKITVSGGDYGWRINYDKMYADTLKLLDKKVSEKKQGKYLSSGDPSAITFTKTVSFTDKGTVFPAGKGDRDYDSKNYTEVDLSAQHVYVFRNGKVKLDVPCITGKDSTPTTTGVYALKERQYYRVLRGTGYVTPVNYWCRITWSGVGFHAAPWQPWGSWSVGYHHSGGSHGCVNLSTANAKKIYNTVKTGEMIVLHH